MTYYDRLGVSSAKPDVHVVHKKYNDGRLSRTTFTGVWPDEEGMVIVPHQDGAGTLSIIAWLAQKCGFGLHWWRKIAEASLIMNIDDMLCVGAIKGPITVLSSFDRNSFLLGSDVLAELKAAEIAFVQRMREWGIELRLSGGETADMPDVVRTGTVNHSMFSRMRRQEVIDAGRMRPGDVLIGFSTTGRAAWEDVRKSGNASNGITAMRHSILHADYATYETFAPELREKEKELKKKLVYTGGWHLEDPLPGDPYFTVLEALLSGPRTFAPLGLGLFSVLSPGELHGLIHCSGGSLAKIGKFGRPGCRFVMNKLPPLPAITALAQKSANVPWPEIPCAYPCGIRLIAALRPQKAEKAIRAAEGTGVEAWEIGHVEQDSTGHTSVLIQAPYVEHEYRKGSGF